MFDSSICSRNMVREITQHAQVNRDSWSLLMSSLTAAEPWTQHGLVLESCHFMQFSVHFFCLPKPHIIFFFTSFSCAALIHFYQVSGLTSCAPLDDTQCPCLGTGVCFLPHGAQPRITYSTRCEKVKLYLTFLLEL